MRPMHVCVCVCVCLLVTWLCPPLCKPMDWSLTGSSVHGILQARILEWVAIPFSRRSSQPRNLAGLLNCRQVFYQLSYPAMPETCVRSLGQIPELGRSLGERNDYPLQHSGLESSVNCTVHGVAESDMTERLSLSFGRQLAVVYKA